MKERRFPAGDNLWIHDGNKAPRLALRSPFIAKYLAFIAFVKGCEFPRFLLAGKNSGRGLLRALLVQALNF